MAKKKRKKRSVKRQKKAVAEKKKRSRIIPEGVWPKITALLLWMIGLIFVFSFFGAAGIGGDYLFLGVTFVIGQAVFAVPFIFLLAGAILLRTEYRHYLASSFFAILLLLIGTAGFLGVQSSTDSTLGGIVGKLLGGLLFSIFGYWVGQIVFAAVGVVGLLIFYQLLKSHRDKEEKEEEIEDATEAELAKEAPKVAIVAKTPEKAPEKPKRSLIPRIQLGGKKKKESVAVRSTEELSSETHKQSGTFVPFPLDLLATERGKPESGNTEQKKQKIKETLENFDIPVEMGDVSVGPTVTQYTLRPAEGIRLTKITALNNNLALALATHPIRIEAPIPGKSLVGVELPNKERAEVRLRNLMQLDEFQKAGPGLPLALGKDVAGQAIFTDLAKMPHMLVAGATGAGKTIFLNTLILSLLQKNAPETLRLILVDPKRVEFHLFSEVPHLLGPVIYDVDKTILAIKWLINEMDQRFRQVAAAGARDIGSYNEIQRKNKKKGVEDAEIMPYVVFVIDELADLMVTKGREIEAGIVRLAQMARAVGIHLVLATQRPSTEVITGLIKANITARVAFKVATQIDSRTILDMGGAEKLLGAGDMLYLSATTPQPKRIQAAYVSEKEARKVVNWLQQREEYKEFNHLNTSLAEALTHDEFGPEEGGGGYGDSDDTLYSEAKDIVMQAQKASASLLQRRLRVGYARAARLLDMLEERGVVGPAEGAKPRKVFGATATKAPEEESQPRTFDDFDRNSNNYG